MTGRLARVGVGLVVAAGAGVVTCPWVAASGVAWRLALSSAALAVLGVFLVVVDLWTRPGPVSDRIPGSAVDSDRPDPYGRPRARADVPVPPLVVREVTAREVLRPLPSRSVEEVWPWEG